MQVIQLIAMIPGTEHAYITIMSRVIVLSILGVLEIWKGTGLSSILY